MINHPDFQFSKIPAGIFVMGSPKYEGYNHDGEEQRLVAITKSFELMKWPVTNEFYNFIVKNKSNIDKCPKTDISWYNAVKFCEKLSELDPEYNYRLPTEAEWEYACRAGTTGPCYDALDDIAWYSKNSQGKKPVGLKKPNAFGLYDMLGNVWEWCNDWYAVEDSCSNIFINKNRLIYINPTGPLSGSSRVSRGGSRINVARNVRAAHRGLHVPGHRTGVLGFRVARTKKI